MGRFTLHFLVACLLIAPGACFMRGARLTRSTREVLRFASPEPEPEPEPLEPYRATGVDQPLNVLGCDLQCCCAGTGYYRDGHCSTGIEDTGRHTVCVEASAAFLEFSSAAGNDLSTPMPQYNFPGVRPGDRWCLCATRWAQAYEAGSAPKVFLRSTHLATLKIVPLELLREHALDAAEADAEVEADAAQIDDMRERLEHISKL